MSDIDDDEVDPLDRMPSGDLRDPHSLFAMARQMGSVHRLGPAELAAFPGASELDRDAQLGGRDHIYACFGRDEAIEVFRDAASFCSSNYADLMGDIIGRSLSLTDDDEHTRLRGLVAHAFRTKALQHWESDLIAPLVHELIDGFIAEGRTDLNRTLARELPIQVIARILGLPSEDYRQFRRWAFDMVSAPVDRETALATSQTVKPYLAGVLEQRRRDPGDDLLSDLVTVEVDGDRLTDTEVFDLVVQVLIAGNDTTYRGTGSLLFALITHPEQLEEVRADPSLLPAAMEELLRWEPPLPFGARTARAAVRLGDHDLVPGDFVLVSLASANRDEKYYERADEFDIHRPHIPHLTFATGPHICIGMHLARLEMRIAVEAVVDRLPELRFDPSADDPYMRGTMMRGPNALPVVFRQ